MKSGGTIGKGAGVDAEEEAEEDSRTSSPSSSSPASSAPSGKDSGNGKDKRFGLVIDAGSSGSRMHVYSWQDPAAVRADWVRNTLRDGRDPMVELLAVRRRPPSETRDDAADAGAAAADADADPNAVLDAVVDVQPGAGNGASYDAWQKKAEPGGCLCRKRAWYLQ
jgi:hypothetical protein